MYNPVEIGERLRVWRKSKGFTQGQLSEKMSINQSFISDIERGRQMPSATVLRELKCLFGLSMDYLHDGKISYDTKNTRVESVNFDSPSSGDVRLNDQEYSYIRRFSAQASAGGGLIPDTEHQQGAIAFPTSWVNANGINSQLAGMIEVKGDSMAPTIPDGAMVLVHLPEMFVQQEGIYAFTREGAVFIKRIIPSNFGDDGKPQVLSLVSDNPAYKVEIVTGSDLNDLRIAGRIRCSVMMF